MAEVNGSPSVSRRLLTAILVGGAAAGVIDIVYAIISVGLRGRSPQWVLQSVASGLLGSEAFNGGWSSALLGLAAHFVIATGAAMVFVLASHRVEVLRRHWVIAGILFGIGVYLVMNFVVLPLSAVPFKINYTWSVFAMGFLSHGLGVGLPIAAAFRMLAAPARTDTTSSRG